jgi:hypothetical protein
MSSLTKCFHDGIVKRDGLVERVKRNFWLDERFGFATWPSVCSSTDSIQRYIDYKRTSAILYEASRDSLETQTDEEFFGGGAVIRSSSTLFLPQRSGTFEIQ